MRIAYIAPYQGPGLLARRPILKNLALAGNVKIELISELLLSRKHEIEIFSSGEVVERSLKFYPAFSEDKPFHANVPVRYASALPIRFVNGVWSNLRVLGLFKKRHRASPFDVVMIYNLGRPQVICGSHAVRCLGLPVVIEYEDDAFVNLQGAAESGLNPRIYLSAARKLLEGASGGIGVSPHLLSLMPASIPKMLLRGVVDREIVKASRQPLDGRKNWVVYSGTHYRSKGLEQLVTAWSSMNLSGWELHIAGRGELTARLEAMAKPNGTIVFHGLLNRTENARFLSEAKIGMNPHDVSQTQGNVFAFKIIEYLAAGLHCITTPMGNLEPEIESGVTYMPDNSPSTIAATLQQVVEQRSFTRLAIGAALGSYGPEAVAASLDNLMQQVAATRSPGQRP
jgi:glycosyltransferase involved in cell wall biosynthesis